MEDKQQKNRGVLTRLADKRRARLAADSTMSFKKFAAKMSLVVAFFLFDGLVIPSAFQAFGLLTRAFAIPIALTLLLAVAVETESISRIK
jgi:uncharacterized membrane protein